MEGEIKGKAGSSPPRLPLPGKIADSNVYPGRKRIKRRPRIILTTPEVRATIGNKSKVMVRIAIRIFRLSILTVSQPYLKLPSLVTVFEPS